MVRRASVLFGLVATLASAGCTQLLGLESPQRGDAASGDGAGSGEDASIVDGHTDSAVTSNACPSSYQVIPVTGTYRFVTASASWIAASADCVDDAVPNSSKHTHLAVITSQMEYSALASMVATDNWIGLSDQATEGTLIWVTAEATTYPPASGSPWDLGEPNNTATLDCVRLAMSGLFAMADCSITKRYICECDVYADDPERY